VRRPVEPARLASRRRPIPRRKPNSNHRRKIMKANTNAFSRPTIKPRTTIPAFVVTLGTMMIAHSMHLYVLKVARYLPQIQNAIYEFMKPIPKGGELFAVFIWIAVFLVVGFIFFRVLTNSLKSESLNSKLVAQGFLGIFIFHILHFFVFFNPLIPAFFLTKRDEVF
jgi:ABC-type xylose transport system permease subunit